MGVLFFIISWEIPHVNQFVNMLFLTIGTILILVSMFRLFWKMYVWVYAPNGSKTKEYICYFDKIYLNQILSDLDKSDFDLKDWNSYVKTTGALKMDCFITLSHDLIAVQLFKFVPYTFEPITKVYQFEGDDVEFFFKFLKEKNKCNKKYVKG